jgi:leucyl aminopeptidase (aminopeptidase T)
MKKTVEKTIKNMLRVNLNIKKTDKVLIFTDNIDKKLRNIAKLVSKKSREISPKTYFTEIPSTGSHGTEPPEVVWHTAFGNNIIKKLKKNKLFTPLISKNANKQQLKRTETIVKYFRQETVNVVIAMSYYSTSHTKFRDLLTSICDTRYASMPLFDEEMFNGAMNVDWLKMSERTKKILRKVNKSEILNVETPNGTCLRLSKKDRRAQADTGMITKKGSFSNLPAGEVFFAPIEGTAEGTLVLDWSPTHKLASPITLYVKQGKVYKVQGNDRYAGHIRKKLSERPENANIAELGIGTNDQAKRPDNILESEKILGTIHVALGDNSSFGGKIRTPFHQDFIFFKPTVMLTYKSGRRQTLIKNGKLKKHI